MDFLDRLLGHDRWTTARLLDLSHNLTDAQLDQPFDIGVGTLRETFEHMIFNVEAWTASMAGQPLDAPRDDRSLAALIDRHERAYETFAAFAHRMRDEQRLDDTFVDNAEWRNSFGGAI
ncbi:MAG TPA: DinB family protein, partial [Thermomicrobiales bacterium]|nr:DinB family protein [Thermomicrobiales bacterium]